ncbi:MAG: hypothetical protein OEY14_04510, partial [Myxococcales bacterium]|nr:hypothetical protein [Myxococcales bacterium]
GSRGSVRQADFFETDWEARLGLGPRPLLLLGNPPWVTLAALGRLGSSHRPAPSVEAGERGLDARTGRANFDVSEWMILRLLQALGLCATRPPEGAEAAVELAMLCKVRVARRLLERVAERGWALEGELRQIDAGEHFGASVSATLLRLRPQTLPASERRWPVFDSLDAAQPSSELGWAQGALTSDLRGHARSERWAGRSRPEWRSGLKHDCARVMQLERGPGGLSSALAGPLELEERYVYPLLRGSDVANGRWPPTRAVLVPQRALGQSTDRIQREAPLTWAYLEAHRSHLEARRSSIYRGQPSFAVFGVGPYTFSPWKVAIAALYKRLAFRLVGPHAGRPVIFDDTVYFLPFEREVDARRALRALESEPARDFFEARIFWDEKRPIHKRLLASLDLDRVAEADDR